MRPLEPKELPGFGQHLIVLHLVGIACDIAVEPHLEELLGRALGVAEPAALDEIGRCLKVAPQIHQALGEAHILADCVIALRVGNDHAVSHALEPVDRALILIEARFGAGGIELEQELSRLLEAKIRRPGADAQLQKLRMVHLEAHVYRETIGSGLEALIGSHHLLVVEVGAAAMRRADDGRDTCLLGSIEHAEAVLHIGRSVIDAGKYMAVQVSHRMLLPEPADRIGR